MEVFSRYCSPKKVRICGSGDMFWQVFKLNLLMWPCILLLVDWAWAVNGWGMGDIGGHYGQIILIPLRWGRQTQVSPRVVHLSCWDDIGDSEFLIWFSVEYTTSNKYENNVPIFARWHCVIASIPTQIWFSKIKHLWEMPLQLDRHICDRNCTTQLRQ